MNSESFPDWLGCPICQGTLSFQDKALYCPDDDLIFPVRDGIALLLPSTNRAEADTFASEYRRRRERQGWRLLSRSELLALPETSPEGWDALYWSVRRQSFFAFVKWLKATRGQEARPLRLADMGAGFGWLAGRLALMGHEVVALDLSCDDAFGLGAARHYCQEQGRALTRVQGTIENAPLRQGQVDVLIYSASLHYVQDLEGCLAAGARALRPDGALVIMDSPLANVKRQDEQKQWLGGRHLYEDELANALSCAGLQASPIRVRRGFSWVLRQFKLRLFGAGTFDLPFIVAELTSSA